MNRLTAEQCRRNRNRDDQWQFAENHRRHVTERLRRLAGAGDRRLCVLGAGNVTDLDLPAIADAFREVHLVDLDGEALARGVARQLAEEPDAPLSGRARQWAGVHLHPDLDVTGIGDRLASLSPETPDEAAMADLVERAGEVGPLCLPGPFDVVVSTGLLSQLIDGVVLCVPQTSPQFMQLLLAVRSGHLRLLARLTRPQGHGLLISDFVSSATVPELSSLADDQVGTFAEHLAATGNFFHGVNPVRLAGLFEQDPILKSLVAAVKHGGHWIWNQRSRQYAVLAIEFDRSALA